MPTDPDAMASETEALQNAGRSTSTQAVPWCVWGLGGSGFVSWWLYVVLVWLSRDFRYGAPVAARPLLSVFCVFAALFGLYVFQIVCATRSHAGGPRPAVVRPIIVVFAIAFRLLLLFSDPIQEVDAYRYLWDGKVSVAGVNPYRYSPHEILAADTNNGTNTESLTRLVRLRDQSAANSEILRRVHYGQLTTIYPPVSQIVFATVASVTPHTAPLPMHLLILKATIISFDLATLWLLTALLKYIGWPMEWSIVYAWCPLVMKEFANSGHLDSIAVFWSVATVYTAVRAFFPLCNRRPRRERVGARLSSHHWTLLAAATLWLGVGAKIYPMVLAPILFLTAWQRVGRLTALLAAGFVLTLSALMIFPMLSRHDSAPPQEVTAAVELTAVPVLPKPTEPSSTPPPVPTTLKTNAAETGLSAFAQRWQMNDFLFLLVHENLRVPADSPAAWFVFTPLATRQHFIRWVAAKTSLPAGQVSFLTARLLTGAVFAGLALWFALQGVKSENPQKWLQAVFLTIAWFWLLQPTQNPWYWIWALPFIPFARSRAWLAMSGLVFLYYARFWFSYHFANRLVPGTSYSGETFFDYVVTWIEFVPWFLWLMWDTRQTRTAPLRVSVQGETTRRRESEVRSE